MTEHTQPEREREIGELEFLVGNACSRVINLLVSAGAERQELAQELEFLAQKSGRLAALLQAGPDGSDDPGTPA